MLTGGPLTQFRKNLLLWFRQFQRDLPWRANRDPYRIWLSEIMLQQTRVAAVIPYYERFLNRFPTVAALAEAPEDEVLRLWAGLGYYSRARNLQQAARAIVANHSGVFPSELDAALDLPGIGSYTSAAILSIAYGKKHAVLDGNVARVLARIAAMRGDLRSGGNWQQLQSMADKFLARSAPGDWNQAMMELGATVCTPRAPQCLLCPVNKSCRARQLGLTDVIPEKRKKREAVDVSLASAVFLDRQNRTLLLPPPNRKNGHADVATLVSAMWHFPTIATDNDPLDELLEHLRKEFKVRVAKMQCAKLPRVRHTVTYRNISIQSFLIRVKAFPSSPRANTLPLEQISDLAISNLTRKVSRAAILALASNQPTPRRRSTTSALLLPEGSFAAPPEPSS
jgi:A/G-specific adenine glycosylase